MISCCGIGARESRYGSCPSGEERWHRRRPLIPCAKAISWCSPTPIPITGPTALRCWRVISRIPRSESSPATSEVLLRRQQADLAGHDSDPQIGVVTGDVRLLPSEQKFGQGESL